MPEAIAGNRKRGRPRKHADGAARQRAYRERSAAKTAGSADAEDFLQRVILALEAGRLHVALPLARAALDAIRPGA